MLLSAKWPIRTCFLPRLDSASLKVDSKRASKADSRAGREVVRAVVEKSLAVEAGGGLAADLPERKTMSICGESARG